METIIYRKRTEEVIPSGILDYVKKRECKHEKISQLANLVEDLTVYQSSRLD